MPLPAQMILALALDTSTSVYELKPQLVVIGVNVQVPPKSFDFHTPSEPIVNKISGACLELANLEMNGNLVLSVVSPVIAPCHVDPPSKDLEKLLFWDPPIIFFPSRLFQIASKPSPSRLALVLNRVPADETVPEGVKYVELSCIPPKYS